MKPERLLSNQELCIWGSGKGAREMAKEYKFGKMGLSLKGSGRITMHMGEESSIILMEMFMMANGIETGLAVLVVIIMHMVDIIMGVEKMIPSMDMVLRLCPMAAIMRATSITARNKAMGSITELMAPTMKATEKITKFMGSAHIID
mmetsp:Transcript_27828/g.12939  ORF Transcript_27828/g.12939 Transcript_27828/m.12939 type:complete len:147 (-) Transcript_27828:306-746(-)|eukprot:CAMPEP_0201284388 /NCGR_PEP_ID=MMETSP1317-20130820/72387_1 /ASSEMBLY_ACC=CAM_ASM_000770 /TAXON_ID=187299 /ORGANISM="Undescribed Undescribed, Strain Undescribed" /LENGTH=146 /DNA_ID=CAMNT_0047604347 /DNA_START=333 /DNA_END=773 /DNA_ORIENTATION=+